MSAEENKALVRRYLEEVFNVGAVASLDKLAAANYTDHSPLPGQVSGLEGLRQRVAMLLTAFPDFHG